MLKSLWHNLNKAQKLGLIILLQFIIVGVFGGVLSVSLRDKQHIIIKENADQITNIPKEEQELYEKALWDTIKQNGNNISENIIRDVAIRDGSYSETVTDDKYYSALFLVDIDSIEQTYVVTLGWVKNGSSVETMAPIIDCPKPEDSKYPNSFCKGTYHDTKSLSLYLPYVVNSSYEDAAPDILIEGNETDKTIRVMLTTCNTDINRQKADQYLQSIPTDLSSYQIIYDVSSVDAICNGEL